MPRKPGSLPRELPRRLMNGGTPLRAAYFKRILSVGLVACIMATIANLATILVTARIAAHGAAAVAGYGISARMEFLMIPLAFGVG